MTSETVNLVEVNVINRTFLMYGDQGSCEEILCDTVDQFMSVLELVRMNKDNTEVVYVTD
jgi:hypothetical protein